MGRGGGMLGKQKQQQQEQEQQAAAARQQQAAAAWGGGTGVWGRGARDVCVCVSHVKTNAALFVEAKVGIVRGGSHRICVHAVFFWLIPSDCEVSHVRYRAHLRYIGPVSLCGLLDSVQLFF